MSPSFFFNCEKCTSLWTSSVVATVLIGRCHWRNDLSIGLFNFFCFSIYKCFYGFFINTQSTFLKHPDQPLVAPRVLVFSCRLNHLEIVKPTSLWPNISKKNAIFLYIVNFCFNPTHLHLPLNLVIFSKQLYSLFTLDGIFYNKIEVTDTKSQWL